MNQESVEEALQHLDYIEHYIKDGVIEGTDTEEQKKQALALLPIIMTKEVLCPILEELVNSLKNFISENNNTLSADDLEKYRWQKEHLHDAYVEFEASGFNNQKQAMIDLVEKAKFSLKTFGVS